MPAISTDFVDVFLTIDVKNVDPKNKKSRFSLKNLKTLNKKRCWQIYKINQTKWKIPRSILLHETTKVKAHTSL